MEHFPDLDLPRKSEGRPFRGAPVSLSLPKRYGFSTALERDFQSKLGQARIVDRICNRSQGAVKRIPESGCKVGIRQSKLRMIKQIEEFCPELHSRALGDAEVLDQREISVHEAWTGERSA